MKFEFTNAQRIYFGLEPVNPQWERVILKGDTYRQESILYFEGDVIKRHIISTDERYEERQYDELTRARAILLPKTGKGKEKKLTASVLESRQAIGVYCILDVFGKVFIGNYISQTTFYDSWWEGNGTIKKELIEWVDEFMQSAPQNYISDLNSFKKATRRNVKFKAGDFFAFKISRSEYGFGRVLLDIDQLKKKSLVKEGHGLALFMAKPVLIKIYTHISDIEKVDIDKLKKCNALPSDYIMDNLLFYGEFEIIGHQSLKAEDFDFPMSHGRHVDQSRYSVFLQWGMISVEQPAASFNKYITADNPFVPETSPSRKAHNPYGYYGIGFRPKFNTFDIKNAIANDGKYDYEKGSGYKTYFDLRNPQNRQIRVEIMKKFGLDPNKSYEENCDLTKTIKTIDLLSKIDS
jgi:hypothetical protein